jgi:pimeloyl-ACP methyl ester carboxylesterase
MRSLLIISLAFASATLSAQSVQYGFNDEVGKYFDMGNNTQLYYEVYGEGEPLLMLHGGVYGYINEFEYLIPKLAEKYQVICLATRGHVKSDIGTEPLTYEQRSNDAYKMIQHLGLEKVTVIGFSDGGHSAFKLATMYPDVVEKMVVMGAADNSVVDRSEPYAYTEEMLMSEAGDYFKGRLENMPEPERWGECLEMLNDLYNNSVTGKETFEKIKCPVLLMNGEGDSHASPEATLAAHRHIPQSSLSIIPGCGHVIFYCNFPAVWESMKPFLGY